MTEIIDVFSNLTQALLYFLVKFNIITEAGSYLHLFLAMIAPFTTLYLLGIHLFKSQYISEKIYPDD